MHEVQNNTDNEKKKRSAEYHKAYYKANAEKIKAYRKANAEERKTYNKAWRQAHTEECKAYRKAYYKANTEERKACIKAWKQAHAEESKAYDKAYAKTWQKAHPEERRTLAMKRRARKNGAPGNATPEDVQARREMFGNLCWICGKQSTAIDHLKPLSKKGSNFPCNLRPICNSCNSSKHANWPVETKPNFAIIYRSVGGAVDAGAYA